MIVVDASVLVDFLIGRPEAVDAVRAATAAREHEPLHAPELIELEALNALRRLVARGAVTERRATEAVADLADARLVRYPHAPLRARIWRLRDELTAYDAAYLALAEAMRDPLLLTGDGGLAARARASLGERGVRQIG
jgi:predicted nucleic acid-binding protein